MYDELNLKILIQKFDFGPLSSDHDQYYISTDYNSLL